VFIGAIARASNHAGREVFALDVAVRILLQRNRDHDLPQECDFEKVLRPTVETGPRGIMKIALRG
jgi:hypothetical protein